MSSMRLREYYGSVVAALVDQPHDMKAIGAAQDIAGLPDLHVLERLEKDIRQPSRRTPAHHTALQRIGRVGETGRHLAKVESLAQLSERGIGSGTSLLDLIGRGLLGNGHQDVAETVLVDLLALRVLAAQERLDLTVAHHDAALHFALAQPC